MHGATHTKKEMKPTQLPGCSQALPATVPKALLEALHSKDLFKKTCKCPRMDIRVFVTQKAVNAADAPLRGGLTKFGVAPPGRQPLKGMRKSICTASTCLE